MTNSATSTLNLVRTLIVRNRANNGGGVFNETGGTVTQNRNLIRLNVPNDCAGTSCT